MNTNVELPAADPCVAGVCLSDDDTEVCQTPLFQELWPKELLDDLKATCGAHGRHVRRRRGAAEGRGEADGVDAGVDELADEAARGRRLAVLQLRVQVRVAHADGKGDEGRRHVRRAH